MTPKWITALKRKGACNDAVDWAIAGNYSTVQEAWSACERADWMCWLLVNSYPHATGQVRLVLCACARTSLKYIPGGEDRPRLAIECAERYARGLATDAELAAARAAAWDAAEAAAWAAARAAAWDAAEAAAWAAARAAAWDAAWAAARAAAWDAAEDAAWDVARAAALKEMSIIVRGMIPDPENLPRVEDM
jgi:hypothetical protein